MENFNNDDVKKMLEMLKEQAENTKTEDPIDTQTTAEPAHSDDEIKDMLKKHFSAEETQAFESGEDYSFDISDFSKTGEVPAISSDDEADAHTDAMTEEQEDNAPEVNVIEETVADEISDSFIDEDIIKEVIGETLGEPDIEAEPETAEESVGDEPTAEGEVGDQPMENDAQNTEETVGEATEEQPVEAVETVEEVVLEVLEETEEIVEETVEEITEAVCEEPTRAFEAASDESDAMMEEPPISEGSLPAEEELSAEEEEPISEESINYDEVLEGQQGTVFNNFVEDFTGDLDDVVFEAEITESRAPDKQYTIFEDWEQLMKDKQYATAEEGIIPPTQEELAHSAEIASRAAKGHTDYFNPVVTDSDLDAVDIALMVALGGESELNQTVGFEKIRQAVHDASEEKSESFENEKIYGFCGEEYTSLAQNSKIKAKYKNERIRIILQAVGTAVLALILLGYEIAGWMGVEFKGIFDITQYPEIHVLTGLQLLFLCVAVSFNKLIKLFKNALSFSSISYIGAMIASFLSILHDVLILTVGYADPGATFHSIAAFLLLISMVYDIFDVLQQSEMFDIVSSSDKKLVLEPYGKLRMGEDDEQSDILDKDSYCISRVPSVSKYFKRTSKPLQNMTGKLASLILSFSVALCVMLVLLLMGKDIGTIVLSFIITLSFALLCAAIFEGEFAFFTVHKILKKYKTGIIGKSSIAEYGKCNIVYFDDFNVFNKKSVRTKGLKLYDNNEIYRILYHTQAVFSKIGGPLKGVFEFATTEMVHSKNVDIKEISKEGIVATVDNRTSVLIGTGGFMKSKGIHPSYTSADLKLEEAGDESIMFIALNGTLGAKLYVTYQFSGEFEKLARKLTARGVGIGIRSSDPNINNKWAKKYGSTKKFAISTVRPTLKEFKPHEKSIEGGVISTKNVRALSEALMMCIKLDGFEAIIGKLRIASIVFIGILSFALVLLSGINTVSMLVLMLASALCASIMMLMTYFYIKH